MNNKLIFWVYCVIAMAVFAFGVAIIKDVSVSDTTYQKLQAEATTANKPIGEYTGSLLDSKMEEIDYARIAEEYKNKEAMIRSSSQTMQQAITCFDTILRE